MSSNGESVKITKIPLGSDNQQQSQVLTANSNQTAQDRTKTTKTYYPNGISEIEKQKNDQNQQQQQPQIKFNQNKPSTSDTSTKQLILPDLSMTLGGVSSEVKSSNLIRSMSMLTQQQKLNNAISSKSNSPLAPLNTNEYEDSQKFHQTNTNLGAKHVPPKIKNAISSNKANLSYMNVSKEQDSFERSGSKSTNKSNYNGNFQLEYT
jgi:hypothetical protein